MTADEFSAVQDAKWEHKTVADLPVQHDSGSCGVFVCMYAKQLLIGAEPAHTFSQKDIPAIRLQIAADLLGAYHDSSQEIA